tara:strand:- start:86652 stop:87242 length:591 start_codon:yes stop_codon:yes gene_type:complete
MIHHLSGDLVKKTPTEIVLECGGVGYLVHISLNTYDALGIEDKLRLYTVAVYKEDSQSLYGFVTEEERELFKNLISVSGIGANTARLILSAMAPAALVEAILTENDETLRKIKGIGPKSAKRMVLELKDKVAKGGDAALLAVSSSGNNTAYNEALSGLSILGFDKQKASKVLTDLLKMSPDISIENLLKEAIKRMH